MATRKIAPPAPSAQSIDELKGYTGSIQGRPIEEALDEHRLALWEAKAILETVSAALEKQFGESWPAGIIQFPLALQRVCRVIDDTTDGLEASVLEERALSIARSKAAFARLDAAVAELSA